MTMMDRYPFCRGKYYFGKSAGTAIEKSLTDAKHSIKIISPYVSTSLFDRLVNQAERGVQIYFISKHCWDTKGDKNAETEKEILKKSFRADPIYEKNTNMHSCNEAKHRVKDENAEQLRKDILKLRWFHLLWFVAGLCFIYPIAIWSAASFPREIAPLIKYLFSMISLFGSGALSVHFIKSAQMRAAKLDLFKAETVTVFSTSPIQSETLRYEYEARPNINLKLVYPDFLHSKIYIIDDAVVYFGSVNFTHSAFHSNYELRAKITDPSEVAEFVKLFDIIYNDVDHINNEEYCEEKLFREKLI